MQKLAINPIHAGTMLLLNEILKMPRNFCNIAAKSTPAESPLTGKLHDRGFTLVEILIVCVIIGILSAIGMSGLALVKVQARNTRAASEIRMLEKDISAYAIERGSYPASLADIGRENLIDPWGNHYQYWVYTAGAMRTAGGWPLNEDYDLFSVGADRDYGQSLTDSKSRDDIIRVNEGGWVGYAANY